MVWIRSLLYIVFSEIVLSSSAYIELLVFCSNCSVIKSSNRFKSSIAFSVWRPFLLNSSTWPRVTGRGCSKRTYCETGLFSLLVNYLFKLPWMLGTVTVWCWPPKIAIFSPWISALKESCLELFAYSSIAFAAYWCIMMWLSNFVLFIAFL